MKKRVCVSVHVSLQLCHVGIFCVLQLLDYFYFSGSRRFPGRSLLPEQHKETTAAPTRRVLNPLRENKEKKTQDVWIHVSTF